MKFVNLLVHLFISLATMAQFDEQGLSDERSLGKQNENRDEGRKLRARFLQFMFIVRKGISQ